MITIKEIAELANVSYTTVSNVIHGKTSQVSQKTIEKINNIIKSTGYTPNMYARFLAKNSSRVIAYIELHSSNFFDSPSLATLLDALESALRELGYYLMIRRIEDANHLLQFLKSWKIDGIFLNSLNEDRGFSKIITELNIPAITIDSYIQTDTISVVRIDDLNGGYLATKHLIENGHRNIAIAMPNMFDSGVDQYRLAGYKKALEEYEIPFLDDHVYNCNALKTDGEKLGGLLADTPGLTAVFATSDMLAIEIIAGLKKRGKVVPDDFSVVGFDDIKISRFISPELTTIRQDFHKKAKAVTDHMMKLIEDPDTAKNDSIMLPVELVERKSVKRIGGLNRSS